MVLRSDSAKANVTSRFKFACQIGSRWKPDSGYGLGTPKLWLVLSGA